MKQCYYSILNISTNATSLDIKKAYRLLALQLHPDKSTLPQSEANESFNQLQLAYETLINPIDRSYYDSHRLEILMESDDDLLHESIVNESLESTINYWMITTRELVEISNQTIQSSTYYTYYGSIYQRITTPEEWINQSVVFGDVYSDHVCV